LIYLNKTAITLLDTETIRPVNKEPHQSL